jgi:pimeloyl-ACP methyl ester carboxylesterase
MRADSKTLYLLSLLWLWSMYGQCQAPSDASGNAADPVFERLQYKFPTKNIILSNGQKIAYVEQGTGPETIIFIHGLGSCLSAWEKNIPDLKRSYRTIALDLPGYGKSSKMNVQAGMAAYAQTVIALMDKLKINKATLVGHSMGGQVALTAALQAPERVQNLILAAPAGLETFTEQQKQSLKLTFTPERIQNTTPEQVITNLKVNFYNAPDDMQRMVDERLMIRQSKHFETYCKIVAGSVAAMLDEPVKEELTRLQMPALIIFGENDALIPNKYFNPSLTPQKVAEMGRGLIPNSQLAVLPKAGHFLQYEQPEAFNQAVEKFMNNNTK